MGGAIGEYGLSGGEYRRNNGGAYRQSSAVAYHGSGGQYIAQVSNPRLIQWTFYHFFAWYIVTCSMPNEFLYYAELLIDILFMLLFNLSFIQSNYDLRYR